MSDVKCPYCRTEQEINHDDGYGYEEDRNHEQECGNCEKEFIFTTAHSISYSVECQPGDHDLRPNGEPHPQYGQFHFCSKCDWHGFVDNTEVA